MATYILKRKTYSDEKQGMSTGKKLALGALGTAGLAAGGFAAAKRGVLGVGAMKSANKLWAKGGQAIGSQNMVKSGRTGFTKALGQENNLTARKMVGVRNNITNAANNGTAEFSMFKDIAK